MLTRSRIRSAARDYWLVRRRHARSKLLEPVEDYANLLRCRSRRFISGKDPDDTMVRCAVVLPRVLWSTFSEPRHASRQQNGGGPEAEKLVIWTR
jgi:hypothetical protein